MKKYLSLLLSVCLLLLSLPAAAESTDGINIDFNTLSEGAVPEGWSAVATSPDSVGAVEVEPGNMAMYLNEGSGSNNEVSLTSPTFNYDKFTVSYKVKFDNTSVYQGFYGNEATTLCLFCSENWFGIRYNGSNYYWATEAEANRWYDIKLFVDNTTYTVGLWIDDQFYVQDQYFRTNKRVEKLNFNIKTNAAAGYMIDDVVVKEEVDESNKPPKITVKGLSDGMVLENETQLTAQITAEDDDGVNFMEIYHNDDLLDTVNDVSYTLELNDLEVGEHTIRIVSEDSAGNRGEEVLNFSVTHVINYTMYTEDFKGYSAKGNTEETSLNGVAGKPQRGYVKSLTVDDEHGTSMAIGIDVANVGYNSGDRAFASIPMNDATGSVSVRLNFYIDKSAASSSPMNINLKKAGGTEQILITLEEGKLKIGDAEVDCADQTWYTCVLKVNIAKKSISMDFGPEGGTLETIVNSLATADGLDLLSAIRVWGPAEDEIKTFIAIDDIIVTRSVDFPTIAEIGSNGKKEGFVVEHSPNTIEIYPSAPLRASSVNKDSVTIEENGRQVNLTDVRYDDALDAIVATPGHSLKSNQTYTVQVSGDVALDSIGKPIGSSISGSFTTTHGDLELLGLEFNDSGSDMSVKYSLENNTEEEKTVDLIVTVWNGEKFVRAKREKLTVAAGNKDFTLTGVEISVGETAEAYLWDCTGAWPKMLANKVYTYQK